MNTLECLHYEYNINHKNENKRKISFYTRNWRKLKNNKNKNLISLRKEVDKEIKKLIQKEKSIYEDKKQKKEKDKLKEDGEKKLFKSTRDEYIIFISYLTKQRKITK